MKMQDLSNLGYKGSITSLEKAINHFAKELRQSGFKVDVDVLKGSSSCPISGYTSQVTIEITSENNDDLYTAATIMANGYGTHVLTVAELKAVLINDVKGQ